MHTLLHREEIEKQKAKERYMKMHLAGKTDQAKADLARLAIIKKQREEAARKKEEEKKGEWQPELKKSNYSVPIALNFNYKKSKVLKLQNL